jgi:formate dehydrogenase major subunit
VEIDPEPGLRIPNMLDAAVGGTFKGLYCQGEDILQSDPDTKHVAAGLAAMECVIVHDLFLNETANYAHVFLPGSTFLEKDGTFTNAERRINRVRKVMAPKNGYADWEITQMLAQAMGADWHYTHPRPDHGGDRGDDALLHGRDLRSAGRGRIGAVALQRGEARGLAGHACGRLRARQGAVHRHRIRGDGRATGPRFPLLLTTGRILSQYNVGAQTRRTENTVWHEEDVLEIHPHDAELRGVKEGIGSSSPPAPARRRCGRP